jgi:hypothetical protein
MPESVQVVYDVNSTGHPFHLSIYEYPNTLLDQFSNLPAKPDEPSLNTGEPQLTLLNQFSAFFRPCTWQTPPHLQLNDIFEDTMQSPAPANTTRLYFINLNGLNLKKEAVKFWDLCEELRKADVHLFAAAEHNLDTNEFSVRQSLQQTARQLFQHHCIQTATSSTLANKFYKYQEVQW